jgi:hypothetical protein
VTSANLTSSGLGLSGDTRGNVEVGVLVDDPDAISTLTATVQEWLSQGRIIDDNWLRKMRAAIDSIPSKEATQRLQEAEAALQGASVDLAGPIFEMQQANERVSEKTEQSSLDGIVEFRESDEIYEIEPPSTCREPRRVYRILKRGREKLKYAPQRCPRCGEMLKGDQLWNHLFYLCPKAPIKRR